MWLSEVLLHEVHLHKVPKRGQGVCACVSAGIRSPRYSFSSPVLSAPVWRRRREGERQFSMSPLQKLHTGIWGWGGGGNEEGIIFANE